MKTFLKSAAGVVALGAALATLSPQASASCSDLPGQPPASGARSPRAQPEQVQPGKPHLLDAAFVQTGLDLGAKFAPIVGMWKFTFTAQGNPPPGPPDGTAIDFGYVTWHSDGTEITNSGGRPPQSGDFCMGVWKQTSPGVFKLNHYAAAWQPDGSAYLGPGNIQELVTLDIHGNSYAGTFSIDQYDSTSTIVLAHVIGTVAATRITVNGGGL